MNGGPQRSMIINFNDGSKKVIGFPAPAADDDANLGMRIDQALNAHHLVFEAEGALLVIPAGSIKYIQISPAPRKLPSYAIRGARFKD